MKESSISNEELLKYTKNEQVEVENKAINEKQSSSRKQAQHVPNKDFRVTRIFSLKFLLKQYVLFHPF